MELGVIGVGAPGMPPAAAREPTTVVLQRKTRNLRPAAAAAAAAVKIAALQACQKLLVILQLDRSTLRHPSGDGQEQALLLMCLL